MNFLRTALVLITICILAPAGWTQTSAPNLNISALIRECERNLDLYEGVYDYSFTQKRIIRVVNKRGEVTKEEIEISEAFPTKNRRKLVLVKVSENGVSRSPQQIAQARERAGRQMEKADSRKESESSADPDKSGYVHLGFKDFLRVGDFYSPRRLRFGDRDALVLDFRPRPDFRPTTRMETVVSNLIGSVWIDAEKKEVMRLEAYPAVDGYKTSSKPLGILRPNAAVVLERRPTLEGVWILSLFHIDTVSLPFSRRQSTRSR